ncbi:MAG: alpha-hydroxy-acid oxidizing protein [Acidobacteria bacterium]|nr:alpha-hydroxy-acid oxidizing protein [Acidobacteriota bacterium]
MADAINLFDFEPLARARISPMAWEYISGGAGDEVTLRWNRDSFDRIRLRPRILVDVSHLDTRVKLFGRELPHPILLAPTAYHRLLHPDGELATVKGAGAAGATMVVSTMATTSVEDIAAAATHPLWFQLYVQPDRSFTRDLVERAQAAGCQALVVTVDTPVVGLRNREMRIKFALPPGMDRPNLKGLKTSSTSHLPPEHEIYSAVLESKLTWKEIDWLRSFARVPVLLKGVLHPDDAERAAQAGVSGIIVSNHGARNLDTVPATIDVLPEVVARIRGRVPVLPVLMDSGIRRGTDVLKALALGASAVFIGRPYLYGLGTAGAEGVTRVINILRREFEMAMALTGKTSIASIDSSLIW